jgi:hypothetical protein
MKRILLISAMLILVSAGTISARIPAKSIGARQATQEARIREGVLSKQLTRKEAAILEREQRRIRIEKRMAKIDGKISPPERKFLNREQNRASKHIERLKNDIHIRG